MSHVFDIVLHLFNSVTTVVYYTGIMKVKAKGKVINELGLVMFLIVSATISHYFRYTPPLRLISVLSVMLMTAILFFDSTLAVKIRTTAEYLLMSMAAEVFGMLVADWLSYDGVNLMEFDSPDRAVMSIVLSTLMAGIIPVAILLRTKAKAWKMWRVALVQTMIAVTQISLILLAYFSAAERSAKIVYIIAIIQIPGILLSLFCSRVIFSLTRVELKAKEQEFHKTKTDMAYDYYKLALESNVKLSMLRHDISNTIQTAMTLIHNGDIQKGKELLGDIDSVNRSTSPLVLCDNDIINVILALKHEEMKKHDITFEVNVKSELSDIPVTDRELTSVITNLLDNAMEACIKCETQRKVIITFGKQQGFYIIKVQNSFREDVYIPNSVADAFTTKDDKESHGLGLRLINTISKRYDGNFSMYEDDGMVVSVVTFAQANNE